MLNVNDKDDVGHSDFPPRPQGLNDLVPNLSLHVCDERQKKKNRDGRNIIMGTIMTTIFTIHVTSTLKLCLRFLAYSLW